MSRFSDVKQGPPIEVFALNKAYQDDTFEKKVNLGVGGNEWNVLNLMESEKNPDFS